jgi:hypothetical protein
MGDAPGLTRVFDDRKMIEQRPKARLFRKKYQKQGSSRQLPNQTAVMESRKLQSVKSR